MKDITLLHVKNLEVVYKRTTLALHGIDLTVNEGQIVGIMGGNGAGKSSILRAITGFIGTDSALITKGSITYKSVRIENRAAHQIAALGIAIIPERDKVFQNLTVAENLAAVVTPNVGTQERRRREEQAYTYFPRLAKFRAREAGLLSGGERQMLAIGAALIAQPDLLLIDELSVGLAPVVVNELAERLLSIKRDLDITMIIVEQSVALALRLADYGYVVESGRVALEGDSAALLANPMVQALYLGGAAEERRNYRDVIRLRDEALHG